jgi:hypothetical protein
MDCWKKYKMDGKMISDKAIPENSGKKSSCLLASKTLKLRLAISQPLEALRKKFIGNRVCIVRRVNQRCMVSGY